MKTMKQFLANALLVVVPSLTFLVIAEIMLRGIMDSELSIKEDERSLMYAHHDTLGWFPSKGSAGTFKGLKSVSVRHNSRGFRDEEHTPAENNGIIVLGDSFVWGYDVEEKDRFTEILDEKLDSAEIFNLGVSGFGTDQQWILLQMHYDFYKPEVVFLMFCGDNDRLDNRMNMRYRYFYKPFFVEENDTLNLRGVPVPTGYRQFLKEDNFASKSYLARLAVRSYFNLTKPKIYLDYDPTFELIKKMKNYSEQRGSIFLVGFQKQDEVLGHLLSNEEIAYVNVENNYQRGWHWNEEGHEFVAEEIEKFLRGSDFSW